MDRQIIDEKLESLRHSIARVDDKYKGTKAANTLLTDYDAQDIIAFNLGSLCSSPV